MFPSTRVMERTEDEIDKLFPKLSSRIYHYTSVDSLFKIVSSQCLLATQIGYLNDLQEYKSGYQILLSCIDNNKEISTQLKQNNDVFEFLREGLPKRSQYSNILKHTNDWYLYQYILWNILPTNVYTISFCTSGDSLGQWIAYAKEDGVSIEFDFSGFTFFDLLLDKKKKELKCEGVQGEDIIRAEIFEKSIPRRVIYIDKEKTKKIGKIIKDLIEDVSEEQKREPDYDNIQTMSWDFVSHLFSIVPFIKTSSFKSEEEVRIAFREKEVNANKLNGIETIRTEKQYHVRNNIIVPYLLVGWRANDTLKYPIKSITIGPGKNKEVNFESIIQFIEDQGEKIIPVNNKSKSEIAKGSYKTKNGIEIKISKIPYIF
jgi:hypothetical protein